MISSSQVLQSYLLISKSVDIQNILHRELIYVNIKIHVQLLDALLPYTVTYVMSTI